MPEGSIELDTPVVCCPAKTHVFIIMGIFIACSLATSGCIIGEYMQMTYSVEIGYLICFLIPSSLCLSEAIYTSYIFCCKSKCCIGYCAIMTFLAAGLNAYGVITSFVEKVPVYGHPLLMIAFPISTKLIGGLGVVVVLNTFYCAFLMCKLSYCDRAGGGKDADDDLYAVDGDLEKSSKTGSISEKTLSKMTGVY